MDALKFLGLLIGVNLVALVLYLIFTPLAPILFWVVNGILLGREYAQLVALRRSDAAGAAAFRRRHRPTIFAAGVLMAVPLTIPVVNLLVPILWRSHVHASAPPPHSGGGEPIPKRVKRSISSMVIAPLRMMAAITAQIPESDARGHEEPLAELRVRGRRAHGYP